MGVMMKAFYCVFLAAVSLLAACGKNPNEADVVVQRAAHNQAQILVRSAPPGTADKVLVYHQGFMQAQDRLLQMDIQRRVGRARLSEIFGEKAVDADRKAMGVGLPHAALKKTRYLIERYPEAHEILQAYTNGVNDFISQMAKLAPDTLSQYRKITGNSNYQPDPWEPADSIAVAQNVSFYLSSNLQQKLMMGQVSAALSGSRDPTSLKLASTLDLRPIFNSFILDADQGQNAWRKQLRQGGRPKKMSAPILPPIFEFPGLPAVGCFNATFPFPECAPKASFGSNNWVVSRDFAGGDTAFLANDPHLRLTYPMTFYEGAYDSTPAGGTLKVRGYGLAGVPGILIGHNSQIAWGMTNLAADVDDVYLEVLDGATNSKVWVGIDEKNRDIYEPLEEETFTLQVRNARGGLTPQPFKLRRVKNHGPVFTEHVPELQAILDKFAQSHRAGISIVGAYKWVGHGESSEFASILAVNRAKNFTEFKAALGDFRSGAQNMVFADLQGDIGYYGHGDFPVRRYVSEGQAPFIPVIPYMRSLVAKFIPAFRKNADWEGIRQEIPELYNPSSGRIITANNDPFGHSESRSLSDYEDYFGWGFSTGVRAQRITELLDGMKGRIDLKSMQAVQTDHKDLMMSRFIDLVRANRQHLQIDGDASAIVDRLLSWDFEMRADRHEPLLADAFIGQLTNAYLDVEAPQVPSNLRQEIDRTAIIAKTIYHRIADGLVSKNEERRKRNLEILATAFTKAAERVKNEKLVNVPWGQVHRLHFYNPLAGIMDSFASYPYERDGSWETVDVAGDAYGPNFRLIMSLKGQSIEAVTSVPGGNYGVFEKRKLEPEMTRWRNGQYRELVPFL